MKTNLGNKEYKIIVSELGGSFIAELEGLANWRAVADTKEKAISNLLFRLEPYQIGYKGSDNSLN